MSVGPKNFNELPKLPPNAFEKLSALPKEQQLALIKDVTAVLALLPNKDLKVLNLLSDKRPDHIQDLTRLVYAAIGEKIPSPQEERVPVPPQPSPQQEPARSTPAQNIPQPQEQTETPPSKTTESSPPLTTTKSEGSLPLSMQPRLLSSEPPVNPGAVLSPEKQAQALKDVSVANFLLKEGKETAPEGGAKKPLEVLQLLKKAESLTQKLQAQEKALQQESAKPPSQQSPSAKANIQNTLMQSKKELQELQSQLPEIPEEDKQKLPPKSAPPEKQLASLKQQAEQALTTTKNAWDEISKPLKEKLASPTSPKETAQQAKQSEKPPTPASTKQQGAPPTPASAKQPGSPPTPTAAKQPGGLPTPTTAKQPSSEQAAAQKSSQVAGKENAPVKTTTPEGAPATPSSKQKTEEQEPLQVVKNSADLKELLAKDSKKEIKFPSTIAVIYPLDGKKKKKGKSRIQAIAEKQEKQKPSSLPNASLAKQEGKGEKKGKSDQEFEGEEEEDQYIQPMSMIPERKSILGDPFHEKRKGEISARVVHVSPFLIGTTSVTNQQFARWLNEAWDEKKIQIVASGTVLDLEGNIVCKTHSGSPHSQIHSIVYGDQITFSPLQGSEYYPVVQVSWFGAQGYAQDYGLRLPSEIERETAAGMNLPGQEQSLEKFRFGFGKNEIDPTIANYSEEEIRPVAFYDGKNVIVKEGVEYQTVNGQSPYGCFDMSGNAYEWTFEGSNQRKMLKGGSYKTSSEDLRVSSRKFLKPDACEPDVSFRVALSFFREL